MNPYLIIGAVILVLSFGWLAHADPQTATDAISKQIGWLVIQNANLQSEVDDLKKQLDECKK